MEFTLTERTEPLTLKEVLDFIDDTNISKKDAHELKSRIVDVVLDSEDRVIDEFAKKIKEVGVECLYHCNDYYAEDCNKDCEKCKREFKEVIDEIAEQMKGV